MQMAELLSLEVYPFISKIHPDVLPILRSEFNLKILKVGTPRKYGNCPQNGTI